MKELETNSWIFVAIAMASQNAPTDFAGISMVADGINHAVPTHKEIQTAISLQASKELVVKKKKKCTLRPIGKREYKFASRKGETIFEIWKNLEVKLNIFT